MKAPAPSSDFEVENRGSVVLLHHRTPRARAWVSEHLPADRMTWMGATIVEPRYLGAIVEGAREDGLVVA